MIVTNNRIDKINNALHRNKVIMGISVLETDLLHYSFIGIIVWYMSVKYGHVTRTYVFHSALCFLANYLLIPNGDNTKIEANHHV